MSYTKATITKIRLPQIGMNNIRERSTRHSQARSMNPSLSPTTKIQQPTTPMHSVHHKNSYYHYSSIIKFDQTPINDLDPFNQTYKPYQSTSIIKTKTSALKRFRNVSNENFLNNFAISRDPRRSAPNLDILLQSARKSPCQKQQIDKKRNEIREKIMQIYEQVQLLLQEHKGYIKQIEKKEIAITLVKLKKEFLLLNQDYNDYYTQPIIEEDQVFKNTIEMLLKLFQPQKLIKQDRKDLLNDSKSITLDSNEIIQLIQEQNSNQQDNQLLSQQSDSNISDISGQMSATKRNIQQKRGTKIVGPRQSKLINLIEQQQIVQQVEQQIKVTPKAKSQQKYKKQKNTNNQAQNNNKYKKININNIDNGEIDINQNYNDSNEEDVSGQTTEKTKQSDRILKGGNQIIRRKNANMIEDCNQKYNIDIQQQEQVILNDKVDKLESEENRRQSEETDRNESQNKEDLLSHQEQIEEILNQVENDIMTYENVQENQRSRGNAIDFYPEIKDKQNYKNQKNINQKTKTVNTNNFQNQQQNIIEQNCYQTINDNNIQLYGLLDALCDCDDIYNSQILNKYRKNSEFTSWDDDIDYINWGQYQFY